MKRVAVIFVILFYVSQAIAADTFSSLDPRVDQDLRQTATPIFAGLILSGGDLLSAVGINLKPSGDNDNYLSFSTIINAPGITIQGGSSLNLFSSTGNAFIRPGGISMLFGWDNDEATSVWSTTGEIQILTTTNNEDITLNPHGTGVTNIVSDLILSGILEFGTNNISDGQMNGDWSLNFGTFTEPGNVDGGVDPAAVTGISTAGGALDAYWEFSDSDGLPTLDDSSNSNDLTVPAGTALYGDRGLHLVSGKAVASKYFDFDGATSLQATAGGGYTGPTQNGGSDVGISISFWYRGISAGNAVFFRFGTTGSGTVGQLRVSVGAGGGVAGALQATYGNGNSSSNTVINDGKWHHIVIVWPGEAGGTIHDNNIYYIDGGSNDWKAAVDGTNHFAPVPDIDFIIGDDTGGSAFLTGQIDEFAVFDNIALTQVQAKLIYDLQKQTFIGGTHSVVLENLDTPISTSRDLYVGDGAEIWGGAEIHGGATIWGQLEIQMGNLDMNGNCIIDACVVQATGCGLGFRIVSENYSILSNITDYTVLADGSSNTVVITLPPISGAPTCIFNIGSIDTTNACSFTPGFGNTIDGSGAAYQLKLNEVVSVQAPSISETDYKIIGRYSAGFFRNVILSGVFVTTPQSSSLLASSTIPATTSLRRVIGNGGAVTMTSTPTIAAGTYDGQMLYLEGLSNTNTVTIQDNDNLSGSAIELNNNVDMTFGALDTLAVRWVLGSSKWVQVGGRSDN